jgi:hypothetical protein
MTHTRLDSFVIGILLAEFTLYYQDKKRMIQIPTWLRLMIILIFLFNFGYILLGDYYKIPLMNYVFKYNYYNLTFFFFSDVFYLKAPKIGFINRLILIFILLFLKLVIRYFFLAIFLNHYFLKIFTSFNLN